MKIQKRETVPGSGELWDVLRDNGTLAASFTVENEADAYVGAFASKMGGGRMAYISFADYAAVEAMASLISRGFASGQQLDDQTKTVAEAARVFGYELARAMRK